MRSSAAAGLTLFALLTVGGSFYQPAFAGVPQSARIEPPVLVKAVQPKGDKTARVDVDCVVLKDGSVSVVKILKSSDAKLNDAAIDALKQWQFRPATKDGKPVPFRLSIEVSFRP